MFVVGRLKEILIQNRMKGWVKKSTKHRTLDSSELRATKPNHGENEEKTKAPAH